MREPHIMSLDPTGEVRLNFPKMASLRTQRTVPERVRQLSALPETYLRQRWLD